MPIGQSKAIWQCIVTQPGGQLWWSNMELMQLAPSGGKIWNQYASGASGGKMGNQCKWRHLVAKFATSSRSFTEINFKLFKLRELLKLWTQYPGSVVPLAMFCIIFYFLAR